jgi:polysaccharide biosynthesis/export protein
MKPIPSLSTLALVLLCGLGSGSGQQIGTKPVVTPAAPESAPAATPAPSAAQTASEALDPNYVIGPGDTIEVNVFNEPKFSGTLPVRPDGMISITLVGDMPAAGFSPMQLANEITARLKKMITDPNVTVSVTGINSKRIYLVGEVGHVGPMAMTPGMTPLQAIATAGGPGAYANTKHIYILRKVGGKEQKLPFNYKKAVKDGDMQGIVLQSGDTIVIP